MNKRILSSTAAEAAIGQKIQWQELNLSAKGFIDYHEGLLESVQGGQLQIDGRMMNLHSLWGCKLSELQNNSPAPS